MLEKEKEGIEEVSPSSDIHRKKRAKTKKDAPVFPGGGRKGVSSGLSTVVRRGEELPKSRHAWWKLLPPGAKGSMRLDR
jgi:RNA exonuclease 4